MCYLDFYLPTQQLGQQRIAQGGEGVHLGFNTSVNRHVKLNLICIDVHFHGNVS